MNVARDPQRTAVRVAGRELSLSNLDKVLYPEVGFTKAQVIDHYTRLSEVILPHLAGRPVTLKRYPDGVEGESFYEKNCPDHRPPWVTTANVESSSSRSNTDSIEFCVVDDLPSLVWVANLASLELHPYLHRGNDPDRPTMVVFDLDPGPPAALLEAAEIALMLREVLDELDLVTVPKTSGGKGIQVYLPVNRPIGYDRTGAFAKAVAQLLERRRPDRITANMRKDLRRGKVLIDHSQNNRHKTTVGVYSLRARATPAVSTPVGWDEVEAAVSDADPDALTFRSPDVLERVAERGDLFAPVLEVEQDLPDPSSD